MVVVVVMAAVAAYSVDCMTDASLEPPMSTHRHKGNH